MNYREFVSRVKFAFNQWRKNDNLGRTCSYCGASSCVVIFSTWNLTRKCLKLHNIFVSQKVLENIPWNRKLIDNQFQKSSLGEFIAKGHQHWSSFPGSLPNMYFAALKVSVLLYLLTSGCPLPPHPTYILSFPWAIRCTYSDVHFLRVGGKTNSS